MVRVRVNVSVGVRVSVRGRRAGVSARVTVIVRCEG